MHACMCFSSGLGGVPSRGSGMEKGVRAVACLPCGSFPIVNNSHQLKTYCHLQPA